MKDIVHGDLVVDGELYCKRLDRLEDEVEELRAILCWIIKQFDVKPGHA